MAAASREDRQSINALQNVPPSNYRDASGPIWKKLPTSIPAPARGGSTSALEKNRANARPPWTRGTMKSNLRQGIIGNPTAVTTIINPQARLPKRQKLESREAESPYFAKGKGKSHTNTRPLIIDNDDEDLGTPLYKDDLNIIDVDAPFLPSSLSTQQAERRRYGGGKAITSLAVRDTSGSSRIVKDGPATRELEMNLDSQDLDPDPIDHFSDEFEPFPRPGLVRERVSKIENADHTKGPRRDLRNDQAPRIKNQMKVKRFQDTVRLQRDSFATTPSIPVSSKSTASQVCVKEWYLGTEHKASDTGYYLSWEKDVMEFKQGRSSPVIQFDVEYEIKSIKYFDPTSGSHIKHPIIAMQTYPPKNSLRPRSSDHFKMGDKHAKGAVTVMFDMRPDNWLGGYQAFIKWIKHLVNDKFVIGDKAAYSVWEVAERSSALGVIDVKRKKLQNSVEEVQPDKQRRSLKRAASVETLDGSPPPVEDMSNNVSDRHNGSTSNSRAATKPPSTSSRNSIAESYIVPRRSSRQSTRQRELSLEADPDEVILCYPQGVPGAVNITNADFRRLQPGEFLNDTLIEFGLKLWLRELEGRNPEVANQVHVFSSFFYKKLNKKDINEGYQSVRKWTSKLDVFSKKFLIVPINENLHWYLAIIYQPEFTLLSPPPSPSPPPPKETRQRAHHAETSDLPAIPPELPTTNADSEEVLIAQETSSECAVERELQQFESSCSLENSSNTTSTPSATGDAMDDQDPTERLFSPHPEMDVDEDRHHHPMASREPSLTVSDYAQQARSTNPSTHDVSMVDLSSSSSYQEENHASRLFDDEIDIEHASQSTAVAPVNFYGTSKKAKGKQKAVPQPQPPIDLGDEDEEEVAISSLPQTPITYIFTMDSLGGRHPAAIKRLQRYLHLEAQDKRNISRTSEARGKQAIVPVQPNFCDCGLYLLHFAETFVNDPDKYCRIITTTTTKTTNEARREHWDDAKTVGMRERMVDEITTLSTVWKKERAEREEAKKSETGPMEIVDSSDDEVDIVDVTPAVEGKGKGKGKGKSSPVRGKAARIRSS